MKIKIICIACLILTLSACQQTTSEYVFWDDTNYTVETESETKAPTTRPVRAAMLLPLSGKTAPLGKCFQNAGMMALNDHAGTPLELMFFDTTGTPDGLKSAWGEAEDYNPDVIIGPIFSSELQALKSARPGIPVLSFSSDSSLVGKNIYSMAVLVPNQIDRLVEFMCASGQKRLAVIGPENKTGELTMNTLSETITRCPGMEMTKISLYNETTNNFTPAVMRIIPKPIDPKRKNLTDEEKAILATPMQERLEFDALLTFEDGLNLQQLISLLAYYDVTPEIVPFYGLASFQTARDRNLAGAYFTTTPSDRAEKFNIRYQRIFGKAPVRIASLGYDAVSLAAILATHNALNPQNLTLPEGQDGVDGRFRLNQDGTNDRLLEIHQLKRNLKSQVIEPAPLTFQDKTAPFWAPPIPDQTAETAETDSLTPEQTPIPD